MQEYNNKNIKNDCVRQTTTRIYAKQTPEKIHVYKLNYFEEKNITKL